MLLHWILVSFFFVLDNFRLKFKIISFVFLYTKWYLWFVCITFCYYFANTISAVGNCGMETSFPIGIVINAIKKEINFPLKKLLFFINKKRKIVVFLTLWHCRLVQLMSIVRAQHHHLVLPSDVWCHRCVGRSHLKAN